jgi:hypothetical protein
MPPYLERIYSDTTTGSMVEIDFLSDMLHMRREILRMIDRLYCTSRLFAKIIEKRAPMRLSSIFMRCF